MNDAKKMKLDLDRDDVPYTVRRKDKNRREDVQEKRIEKLENISEPLKPQNCRFCSKLSRASAPFRVAIVNTSIEEIPDLLSGSISICLIIPGDLHGNG